ncbi:MAG: hypothetical protein J0M04_25355 [Verrucomicrobia bacterium]|nr:hypothetical protein [Verrucomicrobiota bacterium]
MEQTPPELAERFFGAWIAATSGMKPELVDNWRNAAAFTSLVKSNDDCVLRRVANSLGLQCYPHDYYSTDAILFRDRDRVEGAPVNSTWLSGAEVCFEHENFVRSGLYKEVSHLLLMNAGLKVLVTYPIGGVDDPEIENVRSVIQGSRHQAEVAKDRSFLLILGYETGFAWEGFVYGKDGGWERIPRGAAGSNA